MGDVGVLFPAIHAYAYGAQGNSHGKDYYIVDPIRACVESAVLQVCMVVDLLSNNAEKAKQVVANFKPQFDSIEEYIAHKNSVIQNKKTVTYNENGTIKLDF
jgi:nitrogenase subunit NifH